jgi:hypothetical protein
VRPPLFLNLGVALRKFVVRLELSYASADSLGRLDLAKNDSLSC